MTHERMRMLNEIDFAWNANEALWKKNFGALVEYKSIHGDCLVPENYVQNPKLGSWVKTQRKEYRQLRRDMPTSLTRERLKSLESLGFCWDSMEQHWNERYSALLQWKKDHSGNISFSLIKKKDPQLAYWMVHQRDAFNKKRMGVEKALNTSRYQKLKKLCLVSNTKEQEREEEQQETTVVSDESRTDVE